MTLVTKVEAWACRVPLDHPITFRYNTITHRDCTVVRVTTADGTSGAAIGLSRAAPLDLTINELLAPVILGFDALDVGAFHDRAERATSFLDQTGMLAQARSLVDLALWDIRGKAFGAPLWRLLGGNPHPAPVLLVEGYELPGEDDRRFAERVAARADEGFTALKLEAAGYDDPLVLRRRLELIRELAGEAVELVVDVNGAWRSVREAVDTINAFASVRLAWVEDPFPHHRIGDIARLRQEVDVALGAGDDVTNPRDLVDLVDARAVDVLRVDLTTLGGVQETSDVMGAARLASIPISTHAHPAVHQHLTFAWPGAPYVEGFPDDRPFEPSYKLTTGSIYPRIVDGHLEPPTEPGLAIELDLDVVESTAIRYHLADGPAR